MINRLCVIGVGLIGGSLALALKKAGFCKEVVGAGRNEQRLQKEKRKVQARPDRQSGKDW